MVLTLTQKPTMLHNGKEVCDHRREKQQITGEKKEMASLDFNGKSDGWV
jgi:hypothetical protein